MFKQDKRFADLKVPAISPSARVCFLISSYNSTLKPFSLAILRAYVNPFLAQRLHPSAMMDPEEGDATLEGKMHIEKGVYRCYRIAREDAPEEARRYYFD